MPLIINMPKHTDDDPLLYECMEEDEGVFAIRRVMLSDVLKELEKQADDVPELFWVKLYEVLRRVVQQDLPWNAKQIVKTTLRIANT